MRKILIVSNNDYATDLKFLLEESYEVQISPETYSKKTMGDLILLDTRSGDFSLCQALRSEKATQLTPILVLGEHADPEVRAQAFLAGADGYIQKPWHEKELLAQIGARLRNLPDPPGSVHQIRCGNLVMNIDSQEATLNSQLLAISTLEFQLLHYFIVNVGRLVTRKALLDSIWKDSIVSERTIDAHMAILRKKLVGFNHEFQTVYGSGYRLKAIQN